MEIGRYWLEPTGTKQKQDLDWRSCKPLGALAIPNKTGKASVVRKYLYLDALSLTIGWRQDPIEPIWALAGLYLANLTIPMPETSHANKVTQQQHLSVDVGGRCDHNFSWISALERLENDFNDTSSYDPQYVWEVMQPRLRGTMFHRSAVVACNWCDQGADWDAERLALCLHRQRRTGAYVPAAGAMNQKHRLEFCAQGYIFRAIWARPRLCNKDNGDISKKSDNGPLFIK